MKEFGVIPEGTRLINPDILPTYSICNVFFSKGGNVDETAAAIKLNNPMATTRLIRLLSDYGESLPLEEGKLRFNFNSGYFDDEGILVLSFTFYADAKGLTIEGMKKEVIARFDEALKVAVVVEDDIDLLPEDLKTCYDEFHRMGFRMMYFMLPSDTSYQKQMTTYKVFLKSFLSLCEELGEHGDYVMPFMSVNNLALEGRHIHNAYMFNPRLKDGDIVIGVVVKNIPSIVEKAKELLQLAKPDFVPGDVMLNDTKDIHVRLEMIETDEELNAHSRWIRGVSLRNDEAVSFLLGATTIFRPEKFITSIVHATHDTGFLPPGHELMHLQFQPFEEKTFSPKLFKSFSQYLEQLIVLAENFDTLISRHGIDEAYEKFLKAVPVGLRAQSFMKVEKGFVSCTLAYRTWLDGKLPEFNVYAVTQMLVDKLNEINLPLRERIFFSPGVSVMLHTAEDGSQIFEYGFHLSLCAHRYHIVAIKRILRDYFAEFNRLYNAD